MLLPHVLHCPGCLHFLAKFWESFLTVCSVYILQDASSADIRKAYRKLSLILHPDKNKDENAETQFRQVSAMCGYTSFGKIGSAFYRMMMF